MIELDGAASAPVSEKKTRPEKRSPVKNDAKLIAAARELRGRYLEAVNTDPTPPLAEFARERAVTDALLAHLV